MAPTIQNDDTVMIDTGRKSLKEGMIYAIRVDSTVMIKRLSLRLGWKIQIISDNRQEYESYEAELKYTSLGKSFFSVGRLPQSRIV